PLLGDVNFDGHVDVTDFRAMMNALADMDTYRTDHMMSVERLLALADINGDNNFTNADLQALLEYLKSGHGATDIVPEPASWILLGIGVLGLAVAKRKV